MQRCMLGLSQERERQCMFVCAHACVHGHNPFFRISVASGKERLSFFDCVCRRSHEAGCGETDRQTEIENNDMASSEC